MPVAAQGDSGSDSQTSGFRQMNIRFMHCGLAGCAFDQIVLRHQHDQRVTVLRPVQCNAQHVAAALNGCRVYCRTA